MKDFIYFITVVCSGFLSAALFWPEHSVVGAVKIVCANVCFVSLLWGVLYARRD